MLTDRLINGREDGVGEEYIINEVESGVIIVAGAAASLLFVDIMVMEVLLCALRPLLLG
jgi:hypothetical protein